MATRKPHRGSRTTSREAQPAPAGRVGHGEFVVWPGGAEAAAAEHGLAGQFPMSVVVGSAVPG